MIAALHYNPDWLDDDTLLRTFIARQSDFEFLRDELLRTPLTGSTQHHLLVGQRGAGKTTLLKRLAIAIRRDADLADHLIALSFPEELYQVKHLADFWWAACEALAEELERCGDARTQALYRRIDAARGSSDAEAALALLRQTCSELQRRPVLLVDNLDVLIRRVEQGGRSKHAGPADSRYWALRETLSAPDAPILIGGSVSLSEPFTDYDRAFYDFFRPKRLGRLPLAEVRALIQHLATQAGEAEVIERLRTSPGRLHALYDLTGGNPRAVGLIYELLRSGPLGRAVQDFERLMDLTTPYYKARFEDLAAQTQIVMHALAVRRDPEASALRFGHTAAEIAAHTGLATNTVSAQLDVLTREALVEKSSDAGRAQYRIAEQLFRLWLQLRGSRRVRQHAEGLAAFLNAFWDREALREELQKADGYGKALLAYALASPDAPESEQRSLRAHGAHALYEGCQDDHSPFDGQIAPEDLAPEAAALLTLREQLDAIPGLGLSAGERLALLGALSLRIEQKRAVVAVLADPARRADETARLLRLLEVERGKILANGMPESELPLLYRIRAEGHVPVMGYTVAHAEAVLALRLSKVTSRAMARLLWHLLGLRDWVRIHSAGDAQDWLAWGQEKLPDASSQEWAAVAGTLRWSRLLPEAQHAVELAVARGESARAWYEKAVLLQGAKRDFAGAETAYRKAIELDPADAWPWNGLGNLYREELARPSDAEAAFLKAIEVDPADSFPWNNLGLLYRFELHRAEDAEVAFRKAIELDPTYALAWNNLGNLYREKLAHLSDAEAAFLKVIELDPWFFWPWHSLGLLYGFGLGRHEEAEAAFRKAIELDPTHPSPWNNLGNLYREKLARPSDAEAAFLRAIELDPAYSASWNNLGLLYRYELNRPADAEVAFRKAIEFDPGDGQFQLRLGDLLLQQGRLDEAAQFLSSGAELESQFPDWVAERRAELQARRLGQRLWAASQAGDWPCASAELTPLLSAEGATTLAERGLLLEWLKPALQQPAVALPILKLLRELGVDRYAKPVLAAFEAAIIGRADLLDVLEPEVGSASRRIYEELTG